MTAGFRSRGRGGGWPRPAATITEVSQDLATATCRSCRNTLGLDAAAPGNQRLQALFVLSITLGLRPGGHWISNENSKKVWSYGDSNSGPLACHATLMEVWTSLDEAGLAVYLRESGLEESGRRLVCLHGGYQKCPQTGSRSAPVR
jgi:hypothetical protein